MACITPPNLEFAAQKGSGGFLGSAVGQLLVEPEILMLSECVAPGSRSASGTYFDFIY